MPFIRDGPLKKLLGRAWGNFRAARIIFVSISLSGIFFPYTRTFFWATRCAWIFFTQFSLALFFLCFARPLPITFLKVRPLVQVNDLDASGAAIDKKLAMVSYRRSTGSFEWTVLFTFVELVLFSFVESSQKMQGT